MPKAESVNCADWGVDMIPEGCPACGALPCDWCMSPSDLVDALADRSIAAANDAGPTLRLEQHDAIRNAIAAELVRTV